jgi:hypothetical protein
MRLDPRIILGQTYTDDSHGDTFTIVGVEADGTVDLDNGQWYELSGPDGLIAKLNAGTVRQVP